MDLHLVATDFSSNSRIWHAIRHGDGSWTPPGNVNSVAGHPGALGAGQISAVVDEMNLIAGTMGGFGTGGTLWHATRRADGSWVPFVNLNNVIGNPGGIIGFKGGVPAMVGNAPDMHLAALTSDIWGLNGTIWHAIRSPDGSWTPLGNVNKVVGHPGSFQIVAVAEVAGELHLVGGDGSVLWHTIRHADGTWNPFGNVNAVVGNPGGSFQFCALASVNGELHIVALDSHSNSWHAIRHSDGSWTPFGDVMAVVGSRGTQLFGVSGTAITDQVTNAWELHLVGVGVGGILLHTIRKSDGSWTPLENLNAVMGGGPFSWGSISGAKNY